ncbi:Exodeoxyribonuclease I subunit D [Brevinema andersonii]|uniref:Nuclease SbcCD subunit D n=1 Tax=Brevinema andersonii TaxID=34097 RepID=A0A1I1E2Q1_BREAD|nr:exonuclease subunit SbcD [Brevinema andersonii]SFB80962.1 Exodeoxyribonuclease I subunit D [Brevinema andersonii]
MKILCTADWHLGKKLEAFSRLEEQILVMDEIVQYAEEQKVDAVIVAGDCFDTVNPSPEVTKLFVKTLARLSRNGECVVLVIAGNHDSPLFLSSSEAFASQVGVAIVGFVHEVPRLEENSSAWRVNASAPGMIEIFFKKAKKNIRFLLAPYANAQRLKKDFGVEDSSKKIWEVFQKQWQENISQDSDVINILVAHYFVLPEKKDTLIQEEPPVEDEGEKKIGGIGGISAEYIPQGIDYAILGHIHRPQKIFSKNCQVFYTGSPLIYSMSESGQQKTLLILEINRKKSEYYYPLTQGRNIKRIIFDDVSKIENLLQGEDENYIELVWCGDRYLEAHEMHKLNNIHSRLLRVDMQPKFSKTLALNPDIEYIHERSSLELFKDYFLFKRKMEAPESLLAFFETLNQYDQTSILHFRKQGFLPYSLKIQGFYSYKSEVFIDFSIFEEKKFFGIFGSVGVGKSAIIEAIIFALYARTERLGSMGSGSGSSNFSVTYSMMNLESDTMLIEFEFSVIGESGIEEYLCRIHAVRDKKKFEKVDAKREVFRKQNNEWVPQGKISGEEILGLSYDDFRKTIVLQQRDFLNFLHATPSKNAETLMRLFHLERFDLSDQVAILKNENSGNLKALSAQLMLFEDVSDELLSELKERKKQYKIELEYSKHELNSKKKSKEEIQKKIDQLLLLKESKEKIALLEQKKEKIEQAELRLKVDRIIELDDNIKKYINNINESQWKIDQLQKDLTLLQTDSEKEAEIFKLLQQELEEIQTHKKQFIQQKDFWQEQEFDKLIVHLEYQIKQWNQLEARSLELLNKQKTLKIGRSLNDVNLHAQEIKTQLNFIYEEEQKYKSLLGLSGISYCLKPNEPCPLCGSIEHPSPFESIDEHMLENFTQQRLALEKLLEQLRDEYRQVEMSEKLCQNYKDELEQLESQKQNLLNNESLDSWKEKLNQLLIENKQKKENLLQAKTKINEYENLQVELEKKKNMSEIRKYELEKKITQFQSLLFASIDQKNQIQKMLESDIIKKEQELKKIGLSEIEYSKSALFSKMSYEDISNYRKEYAVLENKIKELSHLEINNNIDFSLLLNELEQDVLLLESKISINEQDLGSLSDKIKSLQQNIIQKEMLMEQQKEMLINQENIAILEQLFKAKGFVNFIGQKYLEQLCYYANQRFLRFSRNQFAIEAPSDLQHKGVYVIDRLAGGNKRDISTLSGGQSFQAALALALALADQSRVGHRFFFVDEGFGSLDEENLRIVLQTLYELAQQEQRIVGLISHVPAIQDEVNICLHVHNDQGNDVKIDIEFN